MSLTQKIAATFRIVFIEGVFLGLFAATVIATAAVLGFIRWNFKRIILVWCPDQAIDEEKDSL